MKRGQIPVWVTIVGYLIGAGSVVWASIGGAKVAASSATEQKNTEQDITISQNTFDIKSLKTDVKTIKDGVTRLQCAILGRNDPSIKAECLELK